LALPPWLLPHCQIVRKKQARIVDKCCCHCGSASPSMPTPQHPRGGSSIDNSPAVPSNHNRQCHNANDSLTVHISTKNIAEGLEAPASPVYPATVATHELNIKASHHQRLVNSQDWLLLIEQRLGLCCTGAGGSMAAASSSSAQAVPPPSHHVRPASAAAPCTAACDPSSAPSGRQRRSSARPCSPRTAGSQRPAAHTARTAAAACQQCLLAGRRC
jgi:hypothetical protein